MNKKRQDIRNLEYGVSQPMNPSNGRTDFAGSPSAESNNDPSPAGQDLELPPKREKEDISPYESKVGYRSRKGERFS